MPLCFSLAGPTGAWATEDQERALPPPSPTHAGRSPVMASGPYADPAPLGADISRFVAPQRISGLQMRVS